jgi:hypothetical protein
MLLEPLLLTLPPVPLFSEFYFSTGPSYCVTTEHKASTASKTSYKAKND